MSAGYFTADGRPIIRARVNLPRLGVMGDVDFLVDTGSDTTILHPAAGGGLRCPYDELENPRAIESVSGTQIYYAEPAVISFYETSGGRQDFRIDALSIGKPHPALDELPSLLGRDVLNRLEMIYNFAENRLRFDPP